MAKKIKVTKNGPYLVSGSIPLDKEIIIGDDTGCPIRWEKGEEYLPQENYSLCRCGGSKNLPFCDGTHLKNGFDGKETAKNIPYDEKAEITFGPALDLADVEPLCAFALFCHRAGDAWNLTEKSDDPASKATAIQEAADCPSGRLVAREKKSGHPIEPKFEPSISITEDPPQKVSGPIWVKGGVPIESADGTQYETRNRVTLCRCGRSKNKPFCDGAHIKTGFTDGDKSLGRRSP